MSLPKRASYVYPVVEIVDLIFFQVTYSVIYSVYNHKYFSCLFLTLHSERLKYLIHWGLPGCQSMSCHLMSVINLMKDHRCLIYAQLQNDRRNWQELLKGWVQVIDHITSHIIRKLYSCQLCRSNLTSVTQSSWAKSLSLSAAISLSLALWTFVLSKQGFLGLRTSSDGRDILMNNTRPSSVCPWIWAFFLNAIQCLLILLLSRHVIHLGYQGWGYPNVIMWWFILAPFPPIFLTFVIQ